MVYGRKKPQRLRRAEIISSLEQCAQANADEGCLRSDEGFVLVDLGQVGSASEAPNRRVVDEPSSFPNLWPRGPAFITMRNATRGAIRAARTAPNI